MRSDQTSSCEILASTGEAGEANGQGCCAGGRAVPVVGAMLTSRPLAAREAMDGGKHGTKLFRVDPKEAQERTVPSEGRWKPMNLLEVSEKDVCRSFQVWQRACLYRLCPQANHRSDPRVVPLVWTILIQMLQNVFCVPMRVVSSRPGSQSKRRPAVSAGWC